MTSHIFAIINLFASKLVINNNNNIIFIQGKPLQCRNTVINGEEIDFAKGGKPENTEKNPRSVGETKYNNSIHMSSPFF